jgi:hypothetical protein
MKSMKTKLEIKVLFLVLFVFVFSAVAGCDSVRDNDIDSTSDKKN